MHRARLSEISGQASTESGGSRSRPIRLTEEEALILDAWLGGPPTPPSVVARARIIRAAGDGLSNSEIARVLGVSRGTVILWKRRFEREGLLSLTEVRPGRGRRPTVSLRAAQEILRTATHRRVTRGTAPSYESQAAVCGVSAATVYRVWDAHALRDEASCRRSSPRRGDSPRKVFGVYLDPPDRAVVVAGTASRVDGGEPRPTPSRGLSRVLDRFDRRVAGLGSVRDRERAFLKFLRRVERSSGPHVPLELWVDDEGGVHERPAIRRWLAAHRRYRVKMLAVPSTRELVARAIRTPDVDEAQRRAFFSKLAGDLRGFLVVYDGEPDRFVWLAADD